MSDNAAASQDCGHPNHGSEEHDCTPFLPAAANRDRSSLFPFVITASKEALVTFLRDLGCGIRFYLAGEGSLRDVWLYARGFEP